MLQKNNIPDLGALFESDPARAEDFRLCQAAWCFDYARVPLSREFLSRRMDDGDVKDLTTAVESLFTGQIVNPSENRPALHMALRARQPQPPLDGPGAADLVSVRGRMLEIAGQLYSGAAGLADLIHVGIGGSDLGPRMVAEALDTGDSAVRVHWLATLDGRRAERLMARLDPASTGLVVASKSFATSETMLQARSMIEWLGPSWPDRSWAATANPVRAREAGFHQTGILEFPDWVGGRFSLWSAVGLATAARIGPERWQQLLDGAAEADNAVQSRRGRENFPLTTALALDFLVRTCGCTALGVVSYDPRLGLFAEYLQQLVMESLGKSVTTDGSPVAGPTAPLVFGGRGTDLQHSLFQALHQGTTRHPMLLVGSCRGGHGRTTWQHEQLAHLLAQARALSEGKAEGPPEQHVPGNNPVMLLIAEDLTPGAIGWILASLEHAVYLLGRLWNVNPFDQWGVEEGKRLAAEYRAALGDDPGSAVVPRSLLDLLSRG